MWWNKYIGLRFVPCGRDRQGCDCYGLVRLVLMENFNVAPPLHLGYDDPNNKAEMAALMVENKGAWVSVPAGQERGGDVALFRVAGLPCHVGLVILPGQMLHIQEGTEASIESYNAPYWRRRIEGFYRHADLA